MRLIPDHKLSNKLEIIMKTGLRSYFKHEPDAPGYPDADDLCKFLNSVDIESRFEWSVVPDGCVNPVLPYIHSAALTMEDDIVFCLHPETVERCWDTIEFMKYILHAFNHEGVHHEQSLRKYQNGFYPDSQSGIAWARLKAKGNEDEVMHHYLGEKDEIMAHALDLSTEMRQADYPQVVLRDPECFIDFLPTWQKYRYDGKYSRKDKVIKRLLKYTAAYLEYYETQ